MAYDARADVLEDVYAEAFRYADGVPGIEVHSDPDIVWKVGGSSMYSNVGARLRFGARDAAARLDEVLTRFRRHGEGAAFWVGPGAEPAQVRGLLAQRGLRCRKHFPAMYCDLTRPLPELAAGVPLTFEYVTDYSVFRRFGHPYYGASKSLGARKQETLATRSPRRSWELLAWYDGAPAGVCTVFLGSRYAALFDVGVFEPLRNRGICRSLTRRACRFARDHGARGMVLISTALGHGSYLRAGFEDIAVFGFWYAASARLAATCTRECPSRARR